MSNRPRRRPKWHRSQQHFDVVVHYDDLPEKDITSVDGIPVTTPVRTVIDIAPDLNDDQLLKVVNDAVRRGLLTIQELMTRASEPDMFHRPGMHDSEQCWRR